MTLKDLPIGKTGNGDDRWRRGALRQHFLDMGLIPKADVTMVKFAPMGDPVEVRIHGYELTLRLADAEKIEIDKIRDTITEPMRPQDARPHFSPGSRRGRQVPRADRRAAAARRNADLCTCGQSELRQNDAV